MWTVKVVNSSPSIGGKCRSVTCTKRDDAWELFTKWQGWLDARRDPDLCDKELDIFVAIGHDGYRVIFKKMGGSDPVG